MTASHDSTGQRPASGTTAPHLRASRPSVNGWNAEYLDAEYQRFLANPADVPADLRQFFQGFELARELGPAPVASGGASGAAAAGGESAFQRRVDDLVNAYREMGHLAAKIDPFGRERTRPAALSLAHHGLSEGDLSRRASATTGLLSSGGGTLGELIARLESVYCGSIGAEFMHIPDERERAWFLERFESGKGPAALTPREQVLVLEQLTSAEQFDRFLGKRYQGKKRFSLEGGESLIPLLKWCTQRAGEMGVQEIILGMAHRGRLSVLKNYLGKDLTRLFTEFEDSWTEGGVQGGGDVKYHRGYSGDQPVWDAQCNPTQRAVHLSMLNNPSHLESVNPVVMGRARAKQDIVGDAERSRIASLLIHGDAAVAGQGVVAECLTLSGLAGYSVGGTIHVVINNLVGFTTDPADGRSTTYCTDVGKMVNTPVLHVGADDAEAVVWAARVAAEYRQEFGKDIFIDLVCFRRYGHNEQDEPAYTQPQLYALVKNHPGTPEKYRQKLLSRGVLTPDAAQAMIDRDVAELDAAQAAARAKPVDPVPPPGGGRWDGIQGVYSFDTPKTAVDAKVIAEVCTALGRVPDGFNVHPKLKALLASRAGLPQTKKLSHADAELLAFGTLLLDGYGVRLSGQDCRRGTFTQRHAVLRDEVTNERFTPINNIRKDQKQRAEVVDSPLSEFAVMGFDYGYSRAHPRTLVCWEGQFGDFVNGAQVMIDQFLASSEVKWSRWAGLVLLLPHGYEGQGPEHSSARLERFLQLCADDNMEVVYPTTGAQHFHMLRRQVLRNFRKPLIVMTPKKYLRFEGATIDELSTGSFQHLIDDPALVAAGKSAAQAVTRVVYCSGKIYHELAEKREQLGLRTVAIVRVEQLYPFHASLAKTIDDRYPKSAPRVWAQEEPRNQGAYLYISDVFREHLGVSLAYAGRPASASPATGSEKAHIKQQSRVLHEALGVPESAGKVVPATDPSIKASSARVGEAAPTG